MKKLTLTIGRKDTVACDITIGYDIMDRVGLLLAKDYGKVKCVMLTDSHIASLYGEEITRRFHNMGLAVTMITVAAGEATKNMETALSVMKKLLELGADRTSVIIALGGGVIGDLAGFVASVFMRGISYIQIPTTLMAQVDSSIGGKTAVNLPAGKNLVGAFYHPRLAVIDPAVLDTLDDGNFAAGMAEVIKTACLFDEPLFSLLEAHPGRAAVMPVMDEVITRCCDWKRRVVEADERDTGQRMLLNLGHTLAHALEKCGRPPLAHGQAVAAGMAHILAAAEERGLTRPGTAARLRALLAAFDLPTGLPENVDPAALMEFMARDKKILGGRLNLVLVRRIGEGYIHPMDPAALPEFIGAAPFGEERP